MPSLFEQPIAANPISEFEALPLQFVNQAIQQRQSKYDTAMAEMEAEKNSLLTIKSRAIDKPRARELAAEYDAIMNKAVEDVGGDYSRIRGNLNTIKSRIRTDRSIGELGSIESNYASAASYQDKVQKSYEAGKMSEADYTLAMQSLQGGKTSQLDNGSYSQFSGHQVGPYIDVQEELGKYSNLFHEKYSKDGTVKYKTADAITKDVFGMASKNDRLNSAILKEMRVKGIKNTTANYTKYLAGKIAPIASAESYINRDKAKQVALAKATEEGETNYIVRGRATAPEVKGNSTYVGGAGGMMAEGWRSLFGADNTEYQNWRKSADGKRQAAKYSRVMDGAVLSDDPSTAMDQLDSYYSVLQEDRTGIVEVSAPVTKKAREQLEIGLFTQVGKFRNPNRTFVDAEGQEIDVSDLEGINDAGKRLTSYGGKITGSNSIHPPGTEVFTKDGKDYFALPDRSAAVQSHEMLLWKLKSINRSAADSGKLTLSGSGSNAMGIPNGSYKVTKDKQKFKGGIEVDVYTLSQGKASMKVIYNPKTREWGVQQTKTEK